MKKILAIIITCFMLGAACAGCAPKEDGPEQIDKNRTQLYVGVFDGALGFEWLTEYKKAYETLHPNIQIYIDNKKADYQDGTLVGKMATARQDLYFLSGNNYATFVDLGLLEDITEVISEKAYDDQMNLVKNGTKSIKNALNKDFAELYEKDGRFYGLPNFISPAGIVYDVDLFAEKGYNVPETYNQLISLMRRMVVDGLTPFSFANLDYITLAALSNVWASYEGAHNYNLNNTYLGHDNGLDLDITKDNAYLLQQQEGKRAALTFAKNVMSNNDFTTSKTRSGQTHRNAQDEFIRSIYTVTPSSKRVAMLLESAYWEPEAKTTFEALSRIETDWGWGKRNFGYMPFPAFVGTEGVKDQVNEKKTVYCANTASMVCINKASDQKELAKDFLKFVHSRENLAIFTKYTSSIRPFNFEMTAAEKEACTPFGRNVYDLACDPNIELTYDRSISKIIQKNGEEFINNFKFGTAAKTSDNSSVSGRSPLSLFYNYQNLTVEGYFVGMQNYWPEATWKSLYAAQG